MLIKISLGAYWSLFYQNNFETLAHISTIELMPFNFLRWVHAVRKPKRRKIVLNILKPAFYSLNKLRLARLIQRSVISKCNRKFLELRIRSSSLFCLLLLADTHALCCQQVIMTLLSCECLIEEDSLIQY